MEKIIHKLINDFTEGVDTYTHNGSTWLIFTESKQWVIELTDGKTLWYNYNFFKGIFSYTSMDVVDNQQYITKWVEDNIINKELTYATLFRDARDRKQQFEDALENGVRHTEDMVTNIFVDDTLENGVRHTDILESGRTDSVEDTIQNGVKELYDYKGFRTSDIKDTIQNGVKETNSTLRRTLLGVDDIIQNGIKETRLEMNITEGEVDDIIQDGVKETIECNWNIPKSVINEVVNDGVKHTEYGDWLDGDERLDDIINNGVRDTQSNPYENESWIEGVIKKGVRHTFNTEYMPTSMVEDIIQSGVKETNPVDVMKFFDNKMEDALQNGVKETKQKKNAHLVLDTSGRELILESHLVVRDGVKKTLSAVDNAFTFREVEDTIQNGINETLRASYLNVDNVIQDGVRTSHPRQYVDEKMIDKVLDKGVIETHDDVYHHKGRIDGVIKNGIKETKEMLDWVCTDRMLSNILENGIKETKTPGNGDITSYVDWLKDNKTSGYQGMVEDVIENGVKETVAAGYTDPKTSILHIKWGDQIDDVIDNGVKEVVSYDEHKREPVNTFGYIDDIIKEGVKINGTYAGGQRQSEKCKSVVEYGTKNPTD